MPAAEPMSQEIVERLKRGLDIASILSGDVPLSPHARKELDDAYAALSTLTNLTPSGVERGLLDFLHTELAVAIAFLGRGPGGTNNGDPAKWGAMCDQIGTGLVEADKRVLAALALPSEPPSQGDVEGRQCTIPPAGWWCSREAGHEGPCAARPSSDTHRGWEIRQGRWPEPAWMATGPNYDASYEGPEDGWVDNGQKADAPTREALVEEIDAWIEAHEDDKSCHPSKEDGRS